MQTDQPINIIWYNNEKITTTLLQKKNKSESLIEQQGKLQLIEQDFNDVVHIEPHHHKLIHNYKLSANVNFSLKSQHGNTRQNELDVDGNVKLKSAKKRLIINAQFEKDKLDKTTTADNWLLAAEYDFINKKKLIIMELNRFLKGMKL